MLKGIKLIWRLIRILLKLMLYIIIALVFVVAMEYLISPVYIFPEPKPFSGDKLFNPYEGVDSTHWRKANFQIQSKQWLGITDGRKNTNEAIDSIYALLGYDVPAISDYQHINRYGENLDRYIPVYEHGYGIRKNHHVMIGADHVIWTDYPFFQTIHHKQHMLNVLRPTSELIFIAHPKYAGGWVPDDMRWITNYDGIEVLNGFRKSIEHWDAALSAGKNMRILANDDAHDITNINEVGNYATIIWSPVNTGDSILSALKAGKAYGAYIYRPYGESMEIKVEKAHNLPKLVSVELFGDTLMVTVDRKAKKIRFIGQDGTPLDSNTYSARGRYIFKEKDTYARAEIYFASRTVYYLNPVIRYDGSDPWEHEHARIDHLRTWIFRIIGFATLIFILLNIYYLRRRIIHRRRR